MNTFTAVKPHPDDSARSDGGFTISPSAHSPRLLELTFSAQTARLFMQQAAQWPVQALEYKSFLRFKIARVLDDLCAGQLQPLLYDTLLDRRQGALLIGAEGIDSVAQADEMVNPSDWPLQLRRHERPILRPLCGD